MADLTYEERKRLRRAAEDARDACNRHYGPFVDAVAHPLNILALLDMADQAAGTQRGGQTQERTLDLIRIDVCLPNGMPDSECITHDECRQRLAKYADGYRRWIEVQQLVHTAPKDQS